MVIKIAKICKTDRDSLKKKKERIELNMGFNIIITRVSLGPIFVKAQNNKESQRRYPKNPDRRRTTQFKRVASTKKLPSLNRAIKIIIGAAIHSRTWTEAFTDTLLPRYE